MNGKRRIAALGLAAPTVVVVAAITLNGSAGAASRKVLRGSVPAYATSAAQVGAARGPVHFDVSLPWRHSRALDRLDEAVSDPASPSYGHYLSPAGFRARFSPTAAQVGRVKRWLGGHGFKVTGVSTSRMLVDAVGSVDEVNRAFHTSVQLYRDRHRTLRAPATPLSVPAKIADEVDGVVGIGEEPYKPLAASPDAPPPPAFRNAPPCSNYWGRRFADNQPPAYGQVQPWATCGYAAKELQNAYGVHGAIRRGNDGSGEKVAIIDAFAAPTIRKDVNKYSRSHGLPRVHLRQRVFHGCHNGCDVANQQGWYGEETLDLEAVHSMAPGANIVYLGAADPTFSLIRTLGWAVDHRVARIITNSYGHIGENVSHVQIRASEKIHKEAIAEGIGIYFSSGDDGDESHELGYVSTDYPASSPRVTAVGGTTLAIGPQHNYRFEVGWGTHVTDKSGDGWDPAPPGSFLYGSGGGTTRLFTEPHYQNGVVPKRLARRFGGRGRVVPDISMDGDPNSGMLVGETQTFPNGHRRYDEYRIGGTSLSSPLFAGVMALADQRAHFHHGFVNPALYRLYRSAAFRDVRSAHTPVAVVRRDFVNGVNPHDGTAVSLRTADRDTSLNTKRGYDDVTGLGSPRGTKFLKALAR
jgi:subtilase family serine protease